MTSPRLQRWDGKGRGSTPGNWIFMRIIALAGPFAAYPLCALVTFFWTLRDRRLTAVIRDFHRTLGRSAGTAVVAAHIRAFGVNLIDSMAFLVCRRPPFRLRCVGEEHFHKCLAQGRGVILLSAHLGNWEIAGNLLAQRFTVPINPVMLDNEKEELRRIYARALVKRSFTPIAVNQEPLQMMLQVHAALARNEIVCFLADRVMEGQESLRLPFLGRPATFPVGPFAIAAATGAPVMVVFTVKSGLRTYELRTADVFTIDKSDRRRRRQAIEEGVARFVKNLEAVARRHPLQWFNFYPFWEG